MYVRTLLLVSLALCLCVLCRTTTLAQGGWDVWTLQLRDGSRLEVAPVWSLDARELRYGFSGDGAGKGTPLERRLINYMSNSLTNNQFRASQGATYKRPTLPEDDFKRDLVVMDDGRQVFGPVIIRVGVGKSGSLDIYRPVLVQNGIETDLTRVAYIKFATPAKDSKGDPPGRRRAAGRKRPPGA